MNILRIRSWERTYRIAIRGILLASQDFANCHIGLKFTSFNLAVMEMRIR